MKVPNRFLISILILVLTMISCGQATSQPQQIEPPVYQGGADLHIVSDFNFRLALEGPDGLIARFEKAEGKKVWVDYVGGQEAQRIKSQILSKKSDSFTETDYHAIIFDSSILAENLSDQVFPGKTYPGIWLRKDVADRLGLQPGQILTQEQYAQYMESGQLKMITASALVDTAASLTFFNTLSGYYGPYNQLTLEQVQDVNARAFGKRIYDNYEKSSSNPIQLAVNDSISGQNLYDGVVGFESSFLGSNGLNQQLVNSGKQPFVFFYFNPSVEAKVAMGRAPSIPDGALETYTAFAKFVMSEESQLYILSAGIHPQKNVADPDTNIFKPEWGLLAKPPVDFAAPPTPSVARAALEVYRDLYKRAKEVNIIIDLSGSMGDVVQTPATITIPANFTADDLSNYCGQSKEAYDAIVNDQNYVQGEPYSYNITRLQAVACGIETFADPNWMERYGIKPGPNDVINYWFFSDTVSAGPVATSYGTDTKTASDKIISIIGPTHGYLDTNTVIVRVAENATDANNGNQFPAFQGTRIFDATKYINDKINDRYDENVDYYIVPLTDGENRNGWNGDQYFDYWNNNQKLNITLMGIQFGCTPDPFTGNCLTDLPAEYTQQFGGDSFVGTSSEDLIKAFEKIFGN